MSLSLGLDINNFLTNSETQKSTLFDDIDKLFGNKTFLNNSTSDELFENSELNLLPDPSTEFLNLNSNSNGTTNIISTEPLSNSHYNVGFPEFSLDRIVPTNILPPQPLEYHQHQQSHQLSPILSENYNLYLNHDNNLIPKNQLDRCENRIDSVLNSKSSPLQGFKNAVLSEPSLMTVPRTDSSVPPIGFQQLSNNCHSHLEHINNNSLCETNLSNTANNLSNGQLNINNYPSNCLDLPVLPNNNSNVIDFKSNSYSNVQVPHLNNVNVKNQNELIVPSQNIEKKPPPKFINTFKPLIEPINNQINSSVAKLIAESTKIDDSNSENKIEIIKNHISEINSSNISKEAHCAYEPNSTNTEILNKKNLIKKKRKKKEEKSISFAEISSNKSKPDLADEIDGHKINSEQKHQIEIEPPIQKDSIQSFIEQFRADKNLTLITSEPSYQNIHTTDEPLKKNLKRKTKVNKKTSKKNKLDLDKTEIVNSSVFSHNFKNILLDSGNLANKINPVSVGINILVESQNNLMKDNAGVFSANDNCNYELYSSNQINLIGSTTNQIDNTIPSTQKQLSEFVYPTALVQNLPSQNLGPDGVQQNTQVVNINANDYKTSFSRGSEKECLNINKNQSEFKKSQELNEILDTSDLYALLSSNSDVAFKDTSFKLDKGISIKSNGNKANETSTDINKNTTEVKQTAKELKQVAKQKKTIVKKQNVVNQQSVNLKSPKRQAVKSKNKLATKLNSDVVSKQKESFSVNSGTKTICSIQNSVLQNNNISNISVQNNDIDQIENKNIKSGIYRKLPQHVKEIFKASENVFITKSNPSGAVIKMNQFEEIVLNFKNEYSSILHKNQHQLVPQLEFPKLVSSSSPVIEYPIKKVTFQDNICDPNYSKSKIVGSKNNKCADLAYTSVNENLIDVVSEANVDKIDKTSVTIPNKKLYQNGTINRNPKYAAKDKLMILAYDILKLKNKNFTANREQMKLEVHDPILKKSITYKIIQPHDLSLNSKRLSDLLRLTPSKLNKLNKKKKTKINEQSSLLTKSQPIVRTRYGRILKPTLPNDEIVSLKVDKTKKVQNNKISNILKQQGTLVQTTSGPQNEINSINNLTQVLPNKPAEKSPAVAKYKCQTCNKLFMGKRLQKHYISNPDHNPAIRKSRDIYELSLYKFLVEKIKNSSENEDNRVELFLNEISDLVEQLQIRSSKLVQSTSGIHLVNSKNCKILGIPEGHYSIDINGIDAIPDPITIDDCDLNRLIAPPPVPRLDFSISLDDTITAKLNLSDNCNAPSEESLLRTVNDLVQTDIDKMDEKHLHYDQCDNAVEAMPIKVNETPILDLSLLFKNN